MPMTRCMDKQIIGFINPAGAGAGIADPCS